MWRRTFVALSALTLLAGAGGLAVRTLTPQNVTSIHWSEFPRFGGWSGIDVTEDGNGFVAVADRGSIVRGRFIRVDGRLVGAEADRVEWLKSDTGRKTHKFAEDAEGVSICGPGEVVVSYEGFARVWRHGMVEESSTARIHQATAFQSMRANGSLEAVASLPGGMVMTLEELPRARGTYPVYVNEGDGWRQPFALRREGLWRAVGADIGPDGMLYLLERKFVGFGFMSQIRRFDIVALDGVIEGEPLYRSPPGRHGNLEGIGVWRGADGAMRAVMVADNNFLPIQRGDIVEVVLDR